MNTEYLLLLTTLSSIQKWTKSISDPPAICASATSTPMTTPQYVSFARFTTFATEAGELSLG
jgi:hypothetical protein